MNEGSHISISLKNSYQSFEFSYTRRKKRKSKNILIIKPTRRLKGIYK